MSLHNFVRISCLGVTNIKGFAKEFFTQTNFNSLTSLHLRRRLCQTNSVFSKCKIGKERMGAINCREKTRTSETHERTQSAVVATNSTISSSTAIRKFYTDAMSSEFVEKVVCNEKDIREGEMKQFDLDEENKILLVKQNGKLHALGTKCTHYGAPLHTGYLGEGHIRCPWHGACFKLETGDIEDFPGLDSLPCHQVSVQNGEVNVSVKKSALESAKRVKDMVTRDPVKKETYVIIGGGVSGGVCAETLRQNCFTGRIVLLCKEPCKPYDRTAVTKAMNAPLESLEFRQNEFYEEYGIETMEGVEAMNVDISDCTVCCSNGEEIPYNKLYIATGCKPRRPAVCNSDLDNIFTVRNHADAVEIESKITEETEVVCLGSSFIVLESAAYLASKVKKVTIVGKSAFPLITAFGREIGERVKQLFEDNGVIMRMNDGITQFQGNEDGEVISATMNNGDIIPCTICILGLGSCFNTAFLKDSGITLNDDGSIETDEYLRTNVPNVYAGGDIAKAPVGPFGKEKATIGHYQLAQYHGRLAGLNMAGKQTPMRTVPFFWTKIFGKSFRYAGFGKPHETRIFGSLANLQFVAVYYDRGGDVIAMASCTWDPIVSQFADLYRDGCILSKCCFDEESQSWNELSLKRKEQGCGR